MIYTYLRINSLSLTEYQETIEYLYRQLPMFQRVGDSAFRKDLTNTIKLCEKLDFPHHQFKSVHVAGTNGKGSSSHMLASVLQHAGYKTGLYTSPHLKDFSERIRIDGEPVEPTFVVDFVEKVRPQINELVPSFFEITVAMAFDYFAYHKVDIAVIEVGMGGRLDSTNVILPEVSLITNISMDHSQWLGDTLEKIAAEKAGIIKDNIPVVIGERQPEIKDVFLKKAKECQSDIYFAEEEFDLNLSLDRNEVYCNGELKFIITPDLKGAYQKRNLPGVLKTLHILKDRGFGIKEEHTEIGLANVITSTGLKGRWQVLNESPKVICDVGHNEAGVAANISQLDKLEYDKLIIIWGVVKDKDISKILNLLPKSAEYIFCEASIPRAMRAEELAIEANKNGLKGKVVHDVNDALDQAILLASEKDLIFIGGSTFVVAELDNL
ncbi:MAG: folylpolyglutamate synthase/dihydrofolate synthase family protein [Bacteroidota bacterium]